MTAATSNVDEALWALRAYDTTALATVSSGGPHVAGVFFAPEADGAGSIALLLAVLANSRKHRDIVDDPRVAFICSPGNPSRWIQGKGRASVMVDANDDLRREHFRRILNHAAGARAFIDATSILPAVVIIESMKVVDPITEPPRHYVFAQGSIPAPPPSADPGKTSDS